MTMSQQNTAKNTPKRLVVDRRGTVYTLTNKIGEGGQGVVCATNFPNVLIKINQHKDPKKRQQWEQHIHWLMRQDLIGLQIANPLELIVKPTTCSGYVMELMDGLDSLNLMLDRSHNSLINPESDESLAEYRATGGLRRRILILKELAKILSGLHGRGLAYGDLSPNNIFVSKSLENHQVWLIDCDNICVNERRGYGDTYTPGYAAPEIIRSESGVNIATDCWSFAVIAMQLLTHTHPFDSGIAVEDEDPEIAQEKAHRGELPWIYDQEDDSNAWAGEGLPLSDFTANSQITALLDRCFGAGRLDAQERPNMMEWFAALDTASAVMLVCQNTDCTMSFFYNKSYKCPFCDHSQNQQHYLLLKHFVYLNQPECQESHWLNCAETMILNINEPQLLRLEPIGSTYHYDSPQLCSLTLQENGLLIEPSMDSKIQLQQGTKLINISRQQHLNIDSRSNVKYALHLRSKDVNHDAFHPVWRFIW